MPRLKLRSRIRQLLIAMLFFAGASGGAVLSAELPKIHPAESALEAFRQAGTPVSMSFVQTLRDSSGQILERQEGRLEILPPNRFLWRYQSPYEAEFGSNGVLVWHWDQDLAQITVRDATKVVKGTPLALLLDLKTELPITVDDDGWLSWAPEDGDAQFASLRLRMAENGPAELVLKDFLNQITELTFSNVQRPDSSVDPRFPAVGPEVLVVDERAEP